MIRLFHVLALLLLVGFAFGSYRVNYETQDKLRQAGALSRDIARERESLDVLRAEWAYLNGPERLAALVAEHNDVLGLAPMTPSQMCDVTAIVARLAPLAEESDPVIAALRGMREDAYAEFSVNFATDSAADFDPEPIPDAASNPDHFNAALISTAYSAASPVSAPYSYAALGWRLGDSAFQ